MARIHAFLRLDPARAPEQVDFLRSRVTVLREAGGQFWVAMEDAQVDTLVSQGLSVSVFPDADVLELGPLSYRPASETPQPPEAGVRVQFLVGDGAEIALTAALGGAAVDTAAPDVAGPLALE